MPIVQGQNGNASDFISKSERNATPANDAGKGVRLESDGRLSQEHMEAPNAVDVTIGEAFTGASTPQPAYISKSDGKAYLCDGNDTDKMKFVGFVTSSGSANDTERLVLRGLVRGFSGLSVGEKYYLSDTAGAISTTPGTQEVLVGIAISATTLLIQKGKRFASGIISINSGNYTGQTITTGFRPSVVRLHAVGPAASAEWGASQGGWTVKGGNKCVYYRNDDTTPSTASSSSYAYYVLNGGDNGYFGTVTPGDTSFALSGGDVGSPGANPVYVYWEAEGEL